MTLNRLKMKLQSIYHGLRRATLAGAWALSLLTLLWTGSLRATDQQWFSSPDEAVNALTAAALTHDTNQLHAIFGPEGHELISADAVEASQEYQLFVQRLKEKLELATNTDGSITLDLGDDGWPFPIPLTEESNQWFFNTDAGKSEILNRRIGMDELGAIDVCHAYVEAQREYASEDRLGDGVPAYAQLLRSNPGKHDGLFWPMKDGDEMSPLGPLIAAARGEGYHHSATMMSDKLAPYHGYYFKILTRQGRHAPAGAYNYIIHGRMIAGFALVAWPAEWGNTGIMTFIVNHQGKVYQCNLGKKTAKIASEMTRFNPDAKWSVVP